MAWPNSHRRTRRRRGYAWLRGLGPDGKPSSVLVTPQDSPVANPGFDVTPARLVTGLVTERGVGAASCQRSGAAVPRTPSHG